jgi:hypothetical protein
VTSRSGIAPFERFEFTLLQGLLQTAAETKKR